MLIPPHRAEHLLSRDDFAAMVHQIREQLELGRREGDRPPRPADLAGDQVELDVRGLQRARVRARADAQVSAHAREQLRQRERLDEVVDRSGVKPRDPVLDFAARGEHDHGQRRLLAMQPA